MKNKIKKIIKFSCKGAVPLPVILAISVVVIGSLFVTTKAVKEKGGFIIQKKAVCDCYNQPPEISDCCLVGDCSCTNPFWGAGADQGLCLGHTIYWDSANNCCARSDGPTCYGAGHTSACSNCAPQPTAIPTSTLTPTPIATSTPLPDLICPTVVLDFCDQHQKKIGLKWQDPNNFDSFTNQNVGYKVYREESFLGLGEQRDQNNWYFQYIFEESPNENYCEVSHTYRVNPFTALPEREKSCPVDVSCSCKYCPTCPPCPPTPTPAGKRCDDFAASGGYNHGLNSFDINLGTKREFISGYRDPNGYNNRNSPGLYTISLFYEAFTIPDKFIVSFRNQILLDIGFVPRAGKSGRGSAHVILDLNGLGDDDEIVVSVTVDSNSSDNRRRDTGWVFNLSCGCYVNNATCRGPRSNPYYNSEEECRRDCSSGNACLEVGNGRFVCCANDQQVCSGEGTPTIPWTSLTPTPTIDLSITPPPPNQTLTPTPTRGGGGGGARGLKKWTFVLYFDGNTEFGSRQNEILNKIKDNISLFKNNQGHEYFKDVNVVALYASGNNSRHFEWNSYEKELVDQTVGQKSYMGNSATLIDLLSTAFSHYPNTYYLLSLANHGRGTTGTCWDQEDYLTPAEVYEALKQVLGTERFIDILFYDSSVMQLVEQAFQLEFKKGDLNQVQYLLASQNLGYALYSYDEYLRLIEGVPLPLDLAKKIADRYFGLTSRPISSPQLPLALSVIDLAKIQPIKDKFDNFAEKLKLSTTDTCIGSSRSSSQKFDSKEYFRLGENDSYLDLFDFAQRIKESCSGEMRSAAESLLRVRGDFIAANYFRSGRYNGYSEWDLDLATGVSIYFPQSLDDYDLKKYLTHEIFRYTLTGGWDNFLLEYFGPAALGGRREEFPGIPPMLDPNMYFSAEDQARFSGGKSSTQGFFSSFGQIIQNWLRSFNKKSEPAL